MKPKIDLSWDDVTTRAISIAQKIARQLSPTDGVSIYGVPRGGIPAALLVLRALHLMKQPAELCENPEDADVFIDDILATGDTHRRYRQYTLTGAATFHTLVTSTGDGWYVFPWERMQDEGQGPANNIVRILEYIGEDPVREGLKETPVRVIRSYDELFSGYGQSAEDVLKTFEDGACEEMVVLTNIEFYSHCEHHMMPFFGRAHIGYLPKGKVVGISKLARLLEVFARRLQIQERLGTQIVDALMQHLEPRGAACVIEAQHLCMTSRGVGKQDSIMKTSALRGKFKDDVAVRQEFLSFIHH